MRGSRSFLLCWPVSPERSERASCPRGRGRANLAAAFWGWMELGPPVSLMGVQAARQSVLSCAWGPHPEVRWVTYSRGKASLFGCEGRVGIFILFGTGEGVWGSHCKLASHPQFLGTTCTLIIRGV
uniref:Uncharacterized protein n=1 Tax=Molossus molossus TaxID=27622 RepID=A0A7J8F9R7_MOLMO|nr:hypothetical protein HJG59_008597 [Molossus molossus]